MLQQGVDNVTRMCNNYIIKSNNTTGDRTMRKIDKIRKDLASGYRVCRQLSNNNPSARVLFRYYMIYAKACASLKQIEQQVDALSLKLQRR